MQQQILEKLIEEYREAYSAIPQDALELDLRVTIRTMQALAKGKPVSPTQLAEIWEMPIEQVQIILKQAKENGQAEIDANGNLVGGVLSLNPTPHEVSIGNEHLYAWCAWDAMYAPGVVGKPAQIVSKDPVTGETIRVSMTPAGVETVQPESAVVSVVDTDVDIRGGPESSRCTQMLFFGSRESAEHWKQNRTGVFILTVEEAFELAKEFQIEPAKRLGLVEKYAE
jgi:alkylmercury lyase